MDQEIEKAKSEEKAEGEQDENMFPDIQNLSTKRIREKIQGGLSPEKIALWLSYSTINRVLKDTSVSQLSTLCGALQSKEILTTEEKRYFLEVRINSGNVPALDMLCELLQEKGDDNILEFIQVLEQDPSLAKLGQFVRGVLTRCEDEAIAKDTHTEETNDVTHLKMDCIMEVPDDHDNKLIEEMSTDGNQFSERILKLDTKVTCTKESNILMQFEFIDLWGLQNLQYDISSGLFILRFMPWLQQFGLTLGREEVSIRILDMPKEIGENKEESSAEETKVAEQTVVNMKEPLQFIFTKDNGQMELTEDVANLLCKATKPISVIAIVGKYRTGKSYIMNQFFKSTAGFDLGQTVEASTKGIWLWARPHPLDASRTLILLDTEGLHDVQKGDRKHDIQLFTLAILLSNCLIYNVMGTLDDAIIQELHLVSELTEYIKTNEDKEEKGTYYGQFFPHFFILLRDFYLELQLKGKDCTADQYLDDALAEKAGRGKVIMEYNESRNCIRDFFPHRKCFTICRPVKEEQQLRNLEEMKEEDIRPEFLSQVTEATDAILSEAKPMTIDGIRINGKGFMELVHFYVNCINGDAVPCIETASNLVKKSACEEALVGALDVFDRVMREHLEGKFPVEYEEMAEMQERAYGAAMDHYKKHSLHDDTHDYKNKLRENLETKYQDFKENNNRESEQKCKNICLDVFSSFYDNLNSGTFMVAGGHEGYKKERDMAVEKYKREPNKGPMAEQVLQEKLTTLDRVEKSVVLADQNISQKDKEHTLAMEKLRQELEQTKIAELEKHRAKEDEKRQKEENIKLIKEVIAETEKERAYTETKYQEALLEKEKEYRKLIEEKMHQQAQMYTQLMSEIRIDKKEREKQFEQQIKDRERQFEQQINEIKEHHKDMERLSKEIASKDSKISKLEDQIAAMEVQAPHTADSSGVGSSTLPLAAIMQKTKQTLSDHPSSETTS